MPGRLASLPLCCALGLVSWALATSPAHAQTATASAQQAPRRWIHRHAPRAQVFEVGGFAGTYVASEKHELFNPKLGFASNVHEKLTSAFDMGLRLGYYPLTFLGLELEGARMWAMTDPDQNGVRLWAIRGHALLQLPNYSLAPFILMGGGAIGVESAVYAVGDDNDPAMHFGIGLKAYVSGSVVLRADVRDVAARGLGKNEDSHSLEAIFGLSVALGGIDADAAAEPPPDGDGDGFEDAYDLCPLTRGDPPDGCPARDTDADGVPDIIDACPAQPGSAHDDPALHGCRPPPDRDGDGVPDTADHCPDASAANPDGCPGDRDGDGIRDDQDRCPDEAENLNGFEDVDGCADQLPEEVQRFTGTIEGISFEANSAIIEPSSHALLDAAIGVLTRYPKLQLEISGHTDASGSEFQNRALSKERAEAVRRYLVVGGVEDSRIRTRGIGPDQPIAPNDTPEGRARNRRIEFKLVQ